MSTVQFPPRTDREVAFSEENIPLSPEESTTSGRKWISRVNRARTDLDTASIESRASRHAYILKRPRALHYKKIDDSSDNIPLARRKLTRLPSDSSGESSRDKDERSTDDLLKQISRLDLFVDLVWVGIIANLSRTFGEQAFAESGTGIGPALLEFVLLFIPIWRIWDHLRAFCINFYVDDITQRTFIVWILVLSVLYGINAPYAYLPEGEGDDSLKILIGIYLVTRASFLVANSIQAICIPFLRRQFLFKRHATRISGALWIASIYVHYPGKIGLLVAANFVEHPVDIFLASPIADAYLTPGWKRATHIDHYVDRHEGFFIIILGEGVFRLIEGSPSGWGLNRQTSTIITALLMYYLLHFFYFNGDHTKQFVHALRRTWWKPVLWQG
jgi:low temperature requirement protein LtrA